MLTPSTSSFDLDPILDRDTFDLGEFPLCRILLMNDAHYPWLILVPRRSDISESFQLAAEDQLQLHKESIFTAQALHALYPGSKLNVAALGNVVKQLHVHHVVRFESDIAWPAPVWGAHPSSPYSAADARGVSEHIRGGLADFLKCAEN